MMEAYLTGIGWVTGDGIGCGREGGRCRFSEKPLPALTRKDVFPQPNQRFGRMSEYAKVGIAAIAFALRDAGLEAWETKRPIGVVAASQLGCLATDVDYHQTVLVDGGGLASPNLFAYTLANCFLGDAAIQFGLTGSSIAINETRAGLDALRVALEDLAMGESPTMLAGICDLPAPHPFEVEALQPGAVFLVLSSEPNPAVESYGTVTLSDDGRVVFGMSEMGSIIELIQAALSGRT